MRAERLLDLVALLRRHERLTAAQLAERLGVSRRTVLRDLDALSANGVPVYAEHGRHGGFAMLPGYRAETAGLTDGEATVLFLPGGEPSAEALGRGPEFRSARRKLEAVLSQDAARSLGDLGRWLLIAPEGWGEPAQPPPLVPELAAAAALHRVLVIDYRASGQRPRRRRVRPLGLVLGGRTWYLLALKDDTGEQRTYRVDRVRAVRETGEEFDPPGEGVRAAWDRARREMRERKALRAVVRASAEVTSIVVFVMSTVGQVVEVVDTPDGRRDIVADFDHLRAAAGILAGLASRAEVRSPPELIEKILEISRHNLQTYGPDGPAHNQER